MEGVQSHTSIASGQKRSIKITALVNDLQRVNMIREKMTEEACLDFKKKYGQIMDLLSISVEAPVLSALAQFWNSDLRCFELPSLDLVPTIEEYDIMLNMPSKKNAGVYLYKGSHVEGRKIARLIGLQVNPTEFEKKVWKKSLLEDHLERQAELRNWENFNKTLALLIYGLIIFPFRFGMIDQEAMDVFYQYETQGTNPIPAILAETFLSVKFCLQNNGGTLRCCPHLLYVWFMTHMYSANHMGYMPDPLKSFYRIPVKKQEAREWKEDFLRFNAEHFPWVCPWYETRDTIFSCGNFPNVPLMGPRGCITYTPVIALRQLKWTQVVPRNEELGGWSFQYGANDTKEQQADVRAAWNDIKKKGEKELGKPRAIASADYKEWRKARKAPDLISEETPHKKELPQASNPELVSLTSQLEALKAQMRMMEEKEAQAVIEVETLKRQCKKKDMEIEHLKDECADAYESSKRKWKGKQKETEITSSELQKMQDKIEAMERVMIAIQEEKDRWEANSRIHEQRAEVMKEDLIAAHVEVTKWKNLADDHHNSLTKANQMEELLTMKIEKLTQEHEKSSSKIQKLERKNKDLVKESESHIEYYKEKEKEWRKKCEDMADCVNNHGAELSRLFLKAIEEIDTDQLPLDTYMFLKYCQDLTRSFR